MNREQRTREQGTGNREQGTGNKRTREQGTGNSECKKESEKKKQKGKQKTQGIVNRKQRTENSYVLYVYTMYVCILNVYLCKYVIYPFL